MSHAPNLPAYCTRCECFFSTPKSCNCYDPPAAVKTLPLDPGPLVPSTPYVPYTPYVPVPLTPWAPNPWQPTITWGTGTIRITGNGGAAFNTAVGNAINEIAVRGSQSIPRSAL